MTWRNRLRLFIGLVVITALVGVLTVVFNQRQNEATSTTASIEAEQYPVGIDYGGTVIETEVKNGARVAKGQKLFMLQSPSLQADLEKGLVSQKTIAYSVTSDGKITLRAAVSGTVTDITTQTGSFVQAGQVLATINRAGSLYVSAQYLLAGGDYARVADGAKVTITLPNQATISGKVKAIEVQTVGGRAKSTVRVESDGLVDGAYNNLITSGTPVQATLSLRGDGVFAGVVDGWTTFVHKIGL